MTSKRMLAGMLILLFFVTGSSVWAFGQTRIEGSLVKTSSFDKGTSQYEQVRQFVIQHASNFQKAADFSSFTPESLSVAVTSLIRDETALGRIQQNDNPDSPVALPVGSHQSDDTIEISSCSGGKSQIWTFEWTSSNGGQWVQTGYQQYNLRMCPAPNGGK